MKGVPIAPEVVDAVRACAAAKMTAREAAVQLNKSRNAIIGMAHRNGIVFEGVVTPYQRSKRAKKSLKLPTASQAAQLALKPKMLAIKCSWHGCTGDAELEDIFCRAHAKRGLFDAD